MMTEHIIDRVLAYTVKKHPTYTKEQHMAYIIGFLASIVVEKNLMDNVVWARIRARLDD